MIVLMKVNKNIITRIISEIYKQFFFNVFVDQPIHKTIDTLLEVYYIYFIKLK